VDSYCTTPYARRAPGRSRSNTTPGRDQPRIGALVHADRPHNLFSNCLPMLILRPILIRVD
jgi:hypothetical protein